MLGSHLIKPRWKLAGAYGLSILAAEIASAWRASLDGASALKLLPQIWSHDELDDLTLLCEEQLVHNFSECAELEDFAHLTHEQLGRLLQSSDLNVTREEAVLQGVLKWVNASKGDRTAFFGMLLQQVDCPSLSLNSLEQLRLWAQSAGTVGPGLSKSVKSAMQLHRKRQSDGLWEKHSPKRRRLKHWCPDLGADSERNCQAVTPHVNSPNFGWHDGAFYIADRVNNRVLRCRPGEMHSQIVAGSGASINGYNELRKPVFVAVSPAGDLFVVDKCHRSFRLLKFANSVGQILLEVPHLRGLVCSPNGVLYVADTEKIQRLEGSALTPVIELPSKYPRKGTFTFMFATKDDIYFCGAPDKRIFRFRPGSASPAVVSDFQHEGDVHLHGLHVTEQGKIYVADLKGKRILALNAGETRGVTLELGLPDEVRPVGVIEHDNSLYILHCDEASNTQPIYRCPLPEALVLDSSSTVGRSQHAENC